MCQVLETKTAESLDLGLDLAGLLRGGKRGWRGSGWGGVPQSPCITNQDGEPDPPVACTPTPRTMSCSSRTQSGFALTKSSSSCMGGWARPAVCTMRGCTTPAQCFIGGDSCQDPLTLPSAPPPFTVSQAFSRS